MKFEYPVGSTPLNPDEVEGLIPSHITTQKELNEWEANNILNAETWLFSNRFSNVDFLSIDFIKQVHQKMFNETWKWAGHFRVSEKNIGVRPFNISMDLTNLLDDVSYQIVNQTYPMDEIAYRFHHRLVAIHLFPNGNGRHARLMTDFLLVQAGETRFSWGNGQLENGDFRKKYINALRKADKGEYAELAAFVRS